MATKYVIHNGKIIPSADAKISLQSRALAYGDGCFTTLKSYKNRYLHFTEHYERLKSGLAYIGINFPTSQQNLLNQVKQLIQQNSLEKQLAVVRIQCFRSGNERGYSHISDTCDYVITCSESTENNKAVKLAAVSIPTIPNQCLARTFKFSNSLNYIKAAQEAKTQNADDALMFTINGDVSETTIANIFWIKGATIFTPSAECDLLPGISRSIIINHLANKNDLQVVEGVFNRNNIQEAEAIFCSNSVKELYEVKSIDSREFRLEHPIFLKLHELFQIYKTAHLA